MTRFLPRLRCVGMVERKIKGFIYSHRVVLNSAVANQRRMWEDL